MTKQSTTEKIYSQKPQNITLIYTITSNNIDLNNTTSESPFLPDELTNVINNLKKSRYRQNHKFANKEWKEIY